MSLCHHGDSLAVLLRLAFSYLLPHWSLLCLLRHHILLQVNLKQSLLMRCSAPRLFFIILFSISRCIILFTSNHWTSNEVGVRQFYLFDWYKELWGPFLSDFFQVLLCELVIGVNLFLTFVYACSDINKMLVCMELHKGPEPIQGVRRHIRERINSPLQLQVVGVEHYIRLPLFPHIAQIPEHGELHS
jgi:hypothetical protein